jgi:FKBP-type peptidyl-prolyl cis-trans isomerase SlyD
MNSIANDCVVEINYILKSPNGEIIDSTDGLSPLAYIQGKKNIVHGLENALFGKKLGESFNVTVPAKEAYGEKNLELIQTTTKDKFRNPEDIKLGMQFKVGTETGQVLLVEIIKIEDDQVTLDANHPLAGMDLNFEVKVESIRLASDEELAHGHLHMGAGCCGGGSGGCGSGCDSECH